MATCVCMCLCACLRLDDHKAHKRSTTTPHRQSSKSAHGSAMSPLKASKVSSVSINTNTGSVKRSTRHAGSSASAKRSVLGYTQPLEMYRIEHSGFHIWSRLLHIIFTSMCCKVCVRVWFLWKPNWLWFNHCIVWPWPCLIIVTDQCVFKPKPESVRKQHF